jgi:hypothetical protein
MSYVSHWRADLILEMIASYVVNIITQSGHALWTAYHACDRRRCHDWLSHWPEIDTIRRELNVPGSSPLHKWLADSPAH